MKKLFTLALLTGYLSAAAFNVHFYKDGATDSYSTVSDATKIEFSKDRTIITDNMGNVSTLANGDFSYIKFTESSGVSNVAVSGAPSLLFDGRYITVDAENVASIEVFNINGNPVATTANGEKTCDLGGTAQGTFIVRAVADGNVVVSKIYKKY